MSIGDRIKEVRGKVPRDVFADQLGVVRNTVQRYEVYGKPPHIDFVKSLCRAHNINAEWLLFGTGPKHRGDEKPPPPAELQTSALVDAIETLDQVLELTKRQMSPAEKAVIIKKIYELYTEDREETDKEKFSTILKIIAES